MTAFLPFSDAMVMGSGSKYDGAAVDARTTFPSGWSPFEIQMSACSALKYRPRGLLPSGQTASRIKSFGHHKQTSQQRLVPERAVFSKHPL
jgi:hypothetical protein